MIIQFIFILLSLAPPSATAIEVTDLPKIEYNRDPYYMSEGYKLGYVLNFDRDGLFPYSYEGSMMIGFGSGQQQGINAFVDQYCMETKSEVASGIRDSTKRQQLMDEANQKCMIFSNPWKFSTLDKRRMTNYFSLDRAASTPVLLHYVVPWISIQYIITNTKKFVEGIYPVNPRARVPQSLAIDSAGFPTSTTFNAKSGFVDGRIVSASLDHLIRKSFEVTIQEGELGNNFRRMSVSSQEMFDYILAAMLTGKMLHIGYVELLGFENSITQILRDYDTAYRVISVEIKE